MVHKHSRLIFFYFREASRQKELAILEAQVYRLSEILAEQRVATRENVQRKQVLQIIQ